MLTTIPADVQNALSEAEQQLWLSVYNAVFTQTNDEEKATLAAWGSVRRERRWAVRAIVNEGPSSMHIVKGWGLIFTSASKPDLVDTYFSRMTHLLADYYKDAPLWYEHGWDVDYGWRPIGRRVHLEIYGFGVWAEHVLFPDHPLFERTLREIQEGKLSYSSDSIAHYVEEGFNPVNGEIRAWPLAGWSLTRAPAEPGLGPVTLDGMEAVIREVTSSPARRYTLDGAVLTVSSCKSIPVSRPGPMADAEPPTDDPQAREAQGSDGHPSPVISAIRKDVNMDPQLLASLAEFLGVDATPEAVQQALTQILEMLESGPAAESAALPEARSMRSALELADDASDEDVVAALRSILDLIEASEDDDPAPSYNYEALRTARQRARDLADLTPANQPAPFHTGNGGGARSRGLHAPNINRGAQKPGIIDAIQIASGRPAPNLRTVSRQQALRAVMKGEAHRAVSYSDGPRGAFVLNHEVSDEILDPLIASEVVLAAGADQYEMDGIETLTINKLTSLPEAYWLGEHQTTGDDQPDWGQAMLSLKTLVCKVRLPNRWLRNAGARAEQKVRQAIIDSMRLKMDKAFLLGTGGKPDDGVSTGVEPLGLLNIPGIGTAAVNAAPSLSMLSVAEGSLEDADVEETDSWGWIGHPSLFRKFTYMVDENGLPILRQSWSQGVEKTLVSYPYHKTTQIPHTLGNGSNETYMFLGDWRWFAVGYGRDIELAVSTELYIEYDETLVIAFADVDCAVLYPPAFHVSTGVQL